MLGLHRDYDLNTVLLDYQVRFFQQLYYHTLYNTVPFLIGSNAEGKKKRTHLFFKEASNNVVGHTNTTMDLDFYVQYQHGSHCKMGSIKYR